MSDPFMSAEPKVPEMYFVHEEKGEPPPVIEEAPAPSEIEAVADEPPPTPEIPLSALRTTADGVVLSKVERSAEGVITKILEA